MKSDTEKMIAAVRAAGHELSEASAKRAVAENQSGDTGKCDACAKIWPMSLLDGKREPGAPEESDFTRLEGPCCYGADWREA